MSQVPFNDVFKRQQKKLVPSTFKRAIINQVHPSNGTADVYFIDNPQTLVKSIPLANSVNIFYATKGTRCRVDIFDEKNPNDMVVAYIYGVPFTQYRPIFNSGTASISANNSAYPIAHGLVDSKGNKVTPDIVGAFGLTLSSGVYYFGFWNGQASDPTNLYIDVNNPNAGIFYYPVSWFAIKF